MVKKEMICIGCPLGCMLSITTDDKGESIITGNNCPRGETYANKEMNDPRRIVTTTVRIKGGKTNMVSVKTERDIPKNKIQQCIKELAGIQVNTPVFAGDAIAVNIAGTGVDVVATKTIN